MTVLKSCGDSVGRLRPVRGVPAVANVTTQNGLLRKTRGGSGDSPWVPIRPLVWFFGDFVPAATRVHKCLRRGTSQTRLMANRSCSRALWTDNGRFRQQRAKSRPIRPRGVVWGRTQKGKSVLLVPYRREHVLTYHGWMKDPWTRGTLIN